jgi:enediyne biosynthesis protein E4
VAEMPDFALRDPNNLLLQQADGVFIEAGALAGVASTMIGRGGMVVDLNMDGMLDILVQNRWSGPEVWRNAVPMGGWLQVRLAQGGANRDGIGARVQVRVGDVVQTREISIGGGHMSGHLGWWHFGLGDAAVAEVRVIWPDGTEGGWEPLAANGFYTLRPDTAAEAWMPPT